MKIFEFTTPRRRNFCLVSCFVVAGVVVDTQPAFLQRNEAPPAPAAPGPTLSHPSGWQAPPSTPSHSVYVNSVKSTVTPASTCPSFLLKMIWQMLLLLASKRLCEFGYFVGTRKTCFINLTLQVSRFKTFSEHLVIFPRARNLKEGFTCLTKFMRVRSPWYSPQDRDFIVLFLSSRRSSLTLKKEDNKNVTPHF